MSKLAIITGANGQDGSYLSELLLIKGYRVIAIVRRSSVDTLERLQHLLKDPNFQVIEGDVADPSSVNSIVRDFRPDEFYNLAAQSHVATSFEQPNYTFQVNAVGVLNILEAIRHSSPHTRLYQASTSEMFGGNYDISYDGTVYFEHGAFVSNQASVKYQDENTKFDPKSPYAIAKVAAHNLIKLYRSSYGLYCCSGILFNHESPRRGNNFVTRKITRYIGELYRHMRRYDFRPIGDEFPSLELGNLDARRDWGHAKDYVRAMWSMLNQEAPDDFVIATGVSHSVREFLQAAFSHVKALGSYEQYVKVNPKFFRPSDVEYLQGDASKAKKVLGWEPEIKFEQLVEEMVNYDLKTALSKDV